MEIKHLEYFLEVARYRSFSKAAAYLHVSQPNISKAIKEMEYELGVTLFYRNSKQIQLTDTGELLLSEADKIVSSFQNIRNLLEGEKNLQAGQLHIGLPPITAMASFASTLERFKLAYPNVKIYLYEYGPKRIETMLYDGNLDFGIFTPEDSMEFEWIWFENDPHYLLVNSNNLLAKNESIEYKELNKVPLIIYTKEYKLHDQLLTKCLNSGAVPEIVLETTQFEMMVRMVESNLGVAFLPSKIFRKIKSDSLKCLPMSEKEQTVDLLLALTWRKGRYLSRTAKIFLQIFKNQIE